MQESELSVSTKLREENKMLRNDNDALRDEILELKQRLNDSKKTTSAPANSNYFPGMSQNNFTEQPPREKLSYQRENSAPAPHQLAMERQYLSFDQPRTSTAENNVRSNTESRDVGPRRSTNIDDYHQSRAAQHFE